jgi:hypothetical protein
LTVVPLVPEAGLLAVVEPEVDPLAAGVVLLGVTAVPVFPETPEVVELAAAAGVPVATGAGVGILSIVITESIFFTVGAAESFAVETVPDGTVTFATLLGVLAPVAVVPGVAAAVGVPEDAATGADVKPAGTVPAAAGVSILATAVEVAGAAVLEVSAGLIFVPGVAGVEVLPAPLAVVVFAPFAAVSVLGAWVATPTLIPPVGKGALVVNPVAVTLVCVPESVPVLESPGRPVLDMVSAGAEDGAVSAVVGAAMGRLKRISTPSGVVLQG